MSDSSAENLPFEEALAELERIVRELEDGRITLEDALGRYEQGVGLLKHCHGLLRQAEQRILLLTGMEEGQPLLKPFEHTATAENQVEARRTRARTPNHKE